MERIRLTKIASITSKLDKIADEIQGDIPQAALALDRISDILEGKVALFGLGGGPANLPVAIRELKVIKTKDGETLEDIFGSGGLDVLAIDYMAKMGTKPSEIIKALKMMDYVPDEFKFNSYAESELMKRLKNSAKGFSWKHVKSNEGFQMSSSDVKSGESYYDKELKEICERFQNV